MQITDLTHRMHGEMPVFPGTEEPIFLPANTIRRDGFAESKFLMYSHTGTHIDAPAHMVIGAKTLDQLSIEHFVGKATIIDCTGHAGEIQLEELVRHESSIREVDFVLLKTGWSEFWGDQQYFKGFPTLSIEAAEWLSSFKLKGVGIDTISMDSMETNSFPIHNQFFNKNMILIENLTNLNGIKAEIFLFSCLPLKYDHADGSPVRAVAME